MLHHNLQIELQSSVTSSTPILFLVFCAPNFMSVLVSVLHLCIFISLPSRISKSVNRDSVILIARKFWRPYCGQHKVVPGKVFVKHGDFQKVIRVPRELDELLRSSIQYRAEPGVAVASNAAAIKAVLMTCQKVYEN